MRINVGLNSNQEQLFTELTRVIRQVGEQKGSFSKRVEANKELYREIIELFLAVRLELKHGNFAEMVRASLPPNHEFNFYDPDEKIFKHEKLKNIEVVYGESKPLTEEELAELDLQLRSNPVLDEGNPLRKTFKIDLGKYNELLEEEAKIRASSPVQGGPGLNMIAVPSPEEINTFSE
jgi:hypothetical protein